MQDRLNQQNQELLSVQQALERILSNVKENPSEGIPLRQACGHILAESIFTRQDIPAFSNSGMDGFAVVAADLKGASKSKAVKLEVIGDIPAGVVSSKVVQPGQAMRIMTGAVLPDGADAVVPIEQTNIEAFRSDGPLPAHVEVLRPVERGEYVRPKGQDLAAGDKVLEIGHRIRPQDAGILATLGISQVPVFASVKVGLISSGDELVVPGEDLAPGKIFDSNSYTLAGLIEENGGVVVYQAVAADNEADVRRHFDQAIAAGANMLLSTAGVSVGAFDFIRKVIEKNGKLNFWRVNMRPGKPLAFGTYQGLPFWGLPGNPVSAFVGFEVFVKPAMYKMAGQPNWKHDVRQASLGEAITSDGRESYLRAVVSMERGRLIANLTGHQGSGNLYSLVQANAFIIVPSEVKSLPVGAPIAVWMFGEVKTEAL